MILHILGSNVSEDGGTDMDVETRIQKARGATDIIIIINLLLLLSLPHDASRR
jgi:hypothetical protein